MGSLSYHWSGGQFRRNGSATSFFLRISCLQFDARGPSKSELGDGAAFRGTLTLVKREILCLVILDAAILSCT